MRELKIVVHSSFKSTSPEERLSAVKKTIINRLVVECLHQQLLSAGNGNRLYSPGG